MIEDAELRSLFQAESDERLKHLEEGLQSLEEDPTDMELMEEIFRDAHTIKGSARMLNITPIEQIAHSLEDGLDIARRAKFPLTSPMFRVLYEGIDAIKQYVEQAVYGTKPTIDLPAAITRAQDLAKELEKELAREGGTVPTKEEKAEAAHIAAPAQSQAPGTPEPAAPQPAPIAAPTQSQVPGTPEPAAPQSAPIVPHPATPQPTVEPQVEAPKTAPAQVAEKAALPPKEVIPPPKKPALATTPEKPHEVKKLSSTIRIDTQQVSELLTQAADLTVAKNRILRLFEQIEEMLDFWEKKGRTVAQMTAEFNANQSSIESALRDRAALTQELTETLKKIVDSLSTLRDDSYGDIHKLEIIASSFVDRIRKLTLVPLSKLFDLFPRMVQDVARACSKEIEFMMEGGEITVDKKIIEEMKDPIMHLLRNSISHGVESPETRLQLGKPKKGTILLKAQQTSNSIIIEVIDDGKGIRIDDIKAKALEKGLFTEIELQSMPDAEAQSLIFMPGFSTAPSITDISGRGVGLDVVQNYMKKLNGNVQVESQPGKGCRFIVQLAITLVNTHVMLFQADKRTYAVPIDLIESCNLITVDRLSTIEGHDVVFLQEQPITLVSLKNLVGAVASSENNDALTPGSNSFACVVLKFAGKRLAVIVDAILDEQKVVVTPPGRISYGLRWLIGATILKTGEVCIILNPFDLMQANTLTNTSFSALKRQKQDKMKRKKRILIVEDSYTVRLMLSRVLESEGFDVLQAFNGLEGLDILKKNKVDAIISDVEMPEMDGLTMVSNIRQNKDLYTLPIILMSTKATPEDRQRGLEVGANIYLSKSEYNQNNLIKTLREFLV